MMKKNRFAFEAALLAAALLMFMTVLSACDQLTNGTETPGENDQTPGENSQTPGGNDPVAAGNTFVIYGYNVITSPYIQRSDVKVSHAILDLAKVNAKGLIVQSNATSSRWDSAVGDSITELHRELNASLNVGYEGVLFSGGVSAEFSLSEDTKNESRYAKGRGFHVTRDEYLSDSNPALLKDLITDTFREDISKKSAEQLINDYGTHLMTRVYWGGEAEFNYAYSGTELKTKADIKAALNASYGGFSAEVGVGLGQAASELNSNSTSTSTSRGGNNSGWPSADDFNAGYDNWVQSVQEKPDICGIPNFENDLLPLWRLVAELDQEKADAMELRFQELVTARGTALAGYVYSPPASRTYITAIDIMEQSGTTIPSGMTNLVRKDMYNPADPDVLNISRLKNTSTGLLLNRPEERENLQIAYKTEIKSSANPGHQAIAEIALLMNPPAVIPEGWEMVDWNIDMMYMYLIYRRVNEKDTRAIDFIGSLQRDAKDRDTGYIDSNYEWVTRHDGDGNRFAHATYSSYEVIKSSLEFMASSYSAVGFSVVPNLHTYLTVHYTPFEW
jgi:hypothetical protein